MDVLTMTATPIPRTLNMSLIGVRDISTINSPPAGRCPVETRIIRWDAETIREGILKEIRRGGQIFFLHNSIETIESIRIYLARLVSNVSIAIAHGRLEEKKLEQIMLDFLAGKYDILLTTTIIESGLDIPNVNTMFIHQAERFGLAQLYQLRGRIGRGTRKAYAYLIPSHEKIISKDAYERLETLKQFSEPGSGFKIAMRDLELRGAGNILGSEQHGNIAAVGFELYCTMMENAVKELKGEVILPEISSTVEIKCDAYIPTEYIGDNRLRFHLYKKLAASKDIKDVDVFEHEIIDRFGSPPIPVINLIELIRLKILAFNIGASFVGESNGYIDIVFPPERVPNNRQIKKISETIPDIKWRTGIKPHFTFYKSFDYSDEKILAIKNIFKKWPRDI